MHELQFESSAQRDEIDFFELIHILWQRKFLIVGGTLLATLVAAIITLFLPKVYVVSTIIEPGKIKLRGAGEDSYLITPETVRESILGGAYDLRIMDSLGIVPEDYPEFKVTIPKSTALVKVSVETSNTRQAVDILNSLNKLLASDIGYRYKDRKKYINIQIEELQSKVDKNKDMINLTKAQIEDVVKQIKYIENKKNKELTSGNTDNSKHAYYAGEIKSMQTYMYFLYEKLNNYKDEYVENKSMAEEYTGELQSLSGINVVTPVKVSDRPIKPKKTFIVMLVFVLSSFIMIIIGFILHGVEKRSLVRMESN